MNQILIMDYRLPLIIPFILLVIFTGCMDTSSSQGPGVPTPGVTTEVSLATTPPAASPAQSYPSTALEIKEYVDQAAAWAQENGKEKAIAEFNNATGPFVTGDVYVYALDYQGTALALPFQPAMVGSNFLPLKDASGKLYTEIEIQLAKAGGGYILYRYPYPAGDQQSTLKISYVRPVDDTYWIGAGVYTSEERLVDMDLLELVDDAKVYAQTHGRERAVAEFNNLNGSFVKGDLYIFSYDYNGTVLSWPYTPDQIGANRLNVTDPVGNHHVRDFLTIAKNGGGITDYYSVNPFTNRTDLKISYVTDIDGTWMIGAGNYIEPGPRVLRA